MSHDRTLEHYGTEDTLTAALASDVGRYPTGMLLHYVLEDMVARIAFLETSACGGVFSITANAIKFRPFALAADAYIHHGGTGSLAANASLHATVGRSITASSFLVDC